MPLVAGLSVALVLAGSGGRFGLVLALPAATGVGLLVRRLARAGAEPRLDPRAVAFVLDLLACTLGTGAPPELAIASVSAAVQQRGSADLRDAVEPLRLAGRLLRLGTDPAQAWAVLAGTPGMAQVAAAGQRCARSGARLAAGLAEVATELRAQQHSDAIARAERTGIWALLPLGCCFLPAFVCIGVLPVVLGVAASVLGISR